ncbi:hypothetical protein JX266_013983 [Neoarthrinium moseri]|nr:hypothetical protein JX266_013983 [Neoarthrinium moseri]
MPLYEHPPVRLDSPESIATVYHQRICEVLSIKHNRNGNPWRMIVWPLAQEHPVVYHAIAAMTCFQRSNTILEMRQLGMRHWKISARALLLHQNDSIDIKVELTATLALSLAETWYYPRSTCGINYVQAAKRLLQATILPSSTSSATASLERSYSDMVPFNFLARTWVYMDVLTQITCEDAEAFDAKFSTRCGSGIGPMPAIYDDQIDPLMGCAGSLFPLLGRVADLARTVRKRQTRPNSPAIVANAVELSMSIGRWKPCAGITSGFSNNDDEGIMLAASDLVQTANAYKWATLLLLCQAVPELPICYSFKSIAEKILIFIATVPVESKASIFHVFPLLIAGCDATEREDRDWVYDRWHRLSSGNSSGISDRCLDLTSEVWKRRDSYDEQEQDLEGRASKNAPTRSRCGGFTIISKLHWLSVMKQWGWEGNFLRASITSFSVMQTDSFSPFGGRCVAKLMALALSAISPYLNKFGTGLVPNRWPRLTHIVTGFTDAPPSLFGLLARATSTPAEEQGFKRVYAPQS